LKSLAAPGVDCKLGHMALGSASALLPGLFGAALSLGFSAYEMARAKPDKKKLEALGEFGIGFLVGAVVRELN
jgi:hypothetical protein